MSTRMKIFLATIVEIAVVVFLISFVRDPLPLLVVATVGWPVIPITVLIWSVRHTAKVDMIKLYNFQNIAASRRDLDIIASHHRLDKLGM